MQAEIPGLIKCQCFALGAALIPPPTLPLMLMAMLSCQGPVTREQGISVRHSEVSERHRYSDTKHYPLILSSSPLGHHGCAEGSGCLRAADPTALLGSHLVALFPSWIKGCPHPLFSSLRCANTRGTFETISQKAAAPVCFASKSLHRAVSAANSLSPGPYSATFNLPDSSLAMQALR